MLELPIVSKVTKMINLVLLIILCVIVMLGIVVYIYFYSNMNYDRNTIRILDSAAFVEKQAVLPDGTVLNYGEGPDNGVPLLLIHGQMTSWENYVKALPRLSH